MGTHISRVKSVDLDSWTDEQLQSVLMWGNARANKYWEAKLAPGHVPSEAKIENFIRTKYEAKRWVMDGPIPDPATLDAEEDDDVPLNLVKEKQAIARANSLRGGGVASPVGPSQVRRAPQPDLYANDAHQHRSSSGPPAARQTQANSAPPPQQQKTQKPADSLLGLDFFGTDSQPAPARPSSAAPSSGVPGQSRPDLKQSILSLYASAPKPQATQHQNRGSVSSMASGGAQNNSMAGLDDFAGLSFTSNTSPPPQPQQQSQNAFSSLGSLSNHRSPPPTSPPTQAFGGGFFDVRPQKPAAQPSYSHSRQQSSNSGFGAFDSAPAIPNTSPPVKSSSSGMDDLFDFATPTTSAAPPKPVASPQPSSVFNLTKAQPAPKAAPAPAATSTSQWGSNFDAFDTTDAWGSATSPQPTTQTTTSASANDFGWGSSTTSAVTSPKVSSTGGGFGQSSGGFGQSSGGFGQSRGGFSHTSAAPQVSADEEFGGWSSAPPAASVTKTSQPAKPAAPFAANDDLFSNVWE